METAPRQEFERRFFVYQPELPSAWPKPPQEIEQAYIHIDKVTTRVRIHDGTLALVEFKVGEAHFESSPLPLPLVEARFLIDRYRAGHIIKKLRYRLPGPGSLVWEIDKYLDEENTPLMVVEIETPTKDHPLDPATFPAWVGPEITDNREFKNSRLAQIPFRRMQKDNIAFAMKAMGLR